MCQERVSTSAILEMDGLAEVWRNRRPFVSALPMSHFPEVNKKG